ncbi:FkbM family methyltransferase [Algibacter sp. 2305UL17-15]|uniref:FkbM family methyltransferase n=1 Tax=Algibacter sp. 2305UL17-15 TaxID=3231268 RepID=UPI0034588365
MKKFRHCVKYYGLNGLVIFSKLKLGLTKNISVPGISHPIYLRKSTTDIPTFFQIFTKLEYKIPLKFDPKVIIDLGANIGLGAIYLANKHPNAKIISIEPERSNFEVLKKNTGNYKNIIPLQKAISNLDGQFIEIEDTGAGNWAFMTKVIEKNQSTTSSVETISVKKLMELHDLKHIDILKIDIEGAEKELFESNYEDWMPVTKCIIIELHDDMKKGCSKSLFKCIGNYNFSVEFKGENLVFMNDDLVD